MNDAVISIGSNIEKESNLPEAIRLIRRNRYIEVRKVSRFFESKSVGGPPDAPEFFNAAVQVRTVLDPAEVRTALRHIESVLGRERTEDPDAPRTIDLDLTYYRGVVGDFDGWSLPDALALTAPHVAIPIADIVPDWQHEVTGQTAREIATQFGQSGESVQPVQSVVLGRPYRSRSSEDWNDKREVYAPRFEALVRQQLLEMGEDPEREGLLRTPLRVAKAMDYLTSGYATSLDEIVNGAVFDAEGAEEMILIKEVEFFSLCEHHLLPFFGSATVAYLPKGRIIGLSKVARILDLYARRLQVQERMVNQVADAMERTLQPHGVAVVVKGKHLCMMMRGVQKQDGSMLTSAMRGTFREDPRTRAEFLNLAG